MGLEGVEIIWEVEKHFGISITSDEGFKLKTVGDLVNLIRRRIKAARSGEPHTMRAFLQLRGLVRDVAQDSALRIRPSQLLIDRLSPKDRKELWRNMACLIDVPLEPLMRPLFLRWALAVITAGLVALPIAAVIFEFNVHVGWLVAAPFLIPVSFVATSRLKSIPPPKLRTFGDITMRIVGRIAATRRRYLRTELDVFNELAPIIADVIFVDLDEVTMKARFIDDLGVS